MPCLLHTANHLCNSFWLFNLAYLVHTALQKHFETEDSKVAVKSITSIYMHNFSASLRTIATANSEG